MSVCMCVCCVIVTEGKNMKKTKMCIRGGIKKFRDYFDSIPTDGSTVMHVMWGLAVTVIR